MFLFSISFLKASWWTVNVPVLSFFKCFRQKNILGNRKCSSSLYHFSNALDRRTSWWTVNRMFLFSVSCFRETSWRTVNQMFLFFISFLKCFRQKNILVNCKCSYSLSHFSNALDRRTSWWTVNVPVLSFFKCFRQKNSAYPWTPFSLERYSWGRIRSNSCSDGTKCTCIWCNSRLSPDSH